MNLIDDFLSPENSPETPYAPGGDVVAWRELSNDSQIVEVFRHANDTFGYRFQAWVAWRDAGNFVRSHSWHEIPSKNALYTDVLEEAIRIADTAVTEFEVKPMREWTYAT